MQGNRPKDKHEKNRYGPGLSLLNQPVLPLIHMVQFFFLTGSFDHVADIIDELPSPIETAHTEYRNPAALLHHYDDLLADFEMLKRDDTLAFLVIDEAGERVDRLTAISSRVTQRILTRELERINSLLCGSCDCTLCCTGPDDDMEQEFYEIPLSNRERKRFPLNSVDSDISRRHSALAEPVFMINNRPFYEMSQPALIHWQTGWSLIMPRQSACPHLDNQSGRCLDYAARPKVCRRPQIFPYLLERLPKRDEEGSNGGKLPVYRLRRSLLAVMDCPYVRDLQDDIAAYAAAGELELILTRNKA